MRHGIYLCILLALQTRIWDLRRVRSEVLINLTCQAQSIYRLNFFVILCSISFNNSNWYALLLWTLRFFSSYVHLKYMYLYILPNWWPPMIFFFLFMNLHSMVMAEVGVRAVPHNVSCLNGVHLCDSQLVIPSKWRESFQDPFVS